MRILRHPEIQLLILSVCQRRHVVQAIGSDWISLRIQQPIHGDFPGLITLKRQRHLGQRRGRDCIRLDVAAGDVDDAGGVFVFAAANARCICAARRNDRAAGNADRTAAAFIAAADACATVFISSLFDRRRHRAAGNGNRAAAASIAAADARATANLFTVAARRRYRAAGDGDRTAVRIAAAADARRFTTARRRHIAAGDGDLAAVAIIAAADARAAV